MAPVLTWCVFPPPFYSSKWERTSGGGAPGSGPRVFPREWRRTSDFGRAGLGAITHDLTVLNPTYEEVTFCALVGWIEGDKEFTIIIE
jgi:hypothetical protein